MSYEKIRKRKGEELIPKFLTPAGTLKSMPLIPGTFAGQEMTGYTWTGSVWVPTSQYQAVHGSQNKVGNAILPQEQEEEENYDNGFDEDEYTVNGAADQSKEQDLAKVAEKSGNLKDALGGMMGGAGGGGGAPWGMIGQAAIGINNAIDNTVVGDKKFNAQSQAVDTVVDQAAGFASQFGPWGLMAAGIMKTLNSASKFGGLNVQGFDVDIKSSGYGDIGHMESQANRDWGAFLGLPGIIPNKAVERLLRKRNEQAKMALAASNIAEEQSYEQEARSNSVSNVLQQNQIALAGGIDTSLLGS